MQYETRHISRRRFLSLSAATAAAAVAGFALGPVAASASLRAFPRHARIASDASPEFRAVVDVVEQAMGRTGTPGVALAVFSRGREEIATFGVADFTSREPVLETTRFQNGSLSKTYAATAAMRLREEGRLDINSPVRIYLPGLKLADEYTAEHVTIRHLLTHTGGWWGDAFIETGDDDHALERFVAEQMPRFPQLAPLGEYINYNNSGIALLGRVIEVVTGRTFRQAMRELVLGPLGQNATYDPRVALKQSHATGHGMDDGAIVATTPLLMPRHVDPPGGLWTDIRDQIAYARFHLGAANAGGAQVLGRAAIAEMQTVLKSMPESGSQVAWTWFNESSDGVRLVRHNGDTFGQMAVMVLAPDRQFAFAILANSLTSEPLLKAAEKMALSQYLSVRATGPVYTGTAMSTAALKEYEGTYETPANAAPMTVRAGMLTMRLESKDFAGQIKPSVALQIPEVPVSFVGEDRAVLGSPDEPILPLAFVRRPDGSIGWLTLGDRMIPKTT